MDWRMQDPGSKWNVSSLSVQEREGLVLALLGDLPRSSLSRIHKHIQPQLYVDTIGLLPNELALVALSYLSCNDLLSCRVVNRRWRALADDSALWKRLCAVKGWWWKDPTLFRQHFIPDAIDLDTDNDDEGMGDEEEEWDEMTVDPSSQDDSGMPSTVMPCEGVSQPATSAERTPDSCAPMGTCASRQALLTEHAYLASASDLPPSRAVSVSSPPRFDHGKPDYRLLYLTHAVLLRRFLSGSYSLSHLQSRGPSNVRVASNTHTTMSASFNTHTSTIYCLQLYTYPDSGVQVLFTGSRDRTIREWDLSTKKVQRVISGVHEGSVLSLCARDGLLASAGSDGQTVLYDLSTGKMKAVLRDHNDSVLCVRFNNQFLASCSKDRTIRVYRMPNLTPHLVLNGHRAAVNTIALSPRHIISASGDKSVRVWNTETGHEERALENHHSRGIASIDSEYPAVLTGSSDQHIRLFDVETNRGWSTSPKFDSQAAVPLCAPTLDEDSCTLQSVPVCLNCGTPAGERHEGVKREDCSHTDLVRSVAMNRDFVVSGSYDHRIKIWCRKTGRQIADLTGGHTGRVFCVDFDCTKVVSCGEDQTICIWSFAHGGLDTSFIPL